MFKYLFACIRAIRIKKCKSSCMDIEIEASPPHTPHLEQDDKENKEIIIYNI